MAALSEIIVLGSGSSTGVPTPRCVLESASPPCTVCHKAIETPPEQNKNYRCNPSLMIRFVASPDAAPRYIQIDCGKCFREQVLRWYIHHKIPRMDALILSHEHADAILGLDDIRGLQPFSGPGMPPIQPTPVYVTQHSMDSVIEKFGYLVSDEQKESLHSKRKQPVSNQVQAHGGLFPRQQNGVGQEQAAMNGVGEEQAAMNGADGELAAKPKVFRRVTKLDWRLIDPSVHHPFTVQGLEVTPLPVWHGEDYISLGFEFGSVDRVVYISDVSRIPEDTMEYLDLRKQALGRPRILIIDSLHYTKPHETHFWFPETLAAIKALKPHSAYMIGMTHEFDHDSVNKELLVWSKREGIHVELSWDGLSLPVHL